MRSWQSGHPGGNVTGPILQGELSRTGDGERPKGEPMPHAVFSAQMLPRDITAAPQQARDKIPAGREESKRLIATMRAAARSAVKEWRRRGVEPTQRMMFDMDVFREETSALLDSHLRAGEEAAQRLAREGLSVPSAAAHDLAERLTFHAVRTCKGLAVSPVNLQRLLARAMPGGHYDARDFIKFAIGMRALADSNHRVREFLSKSADDVTAADMRPMVSLVRNYAARQAGRVRFDDDGRIIGEVARDHVAGFGPDAFASLEAALGSIEREAQNSHHATVSLSPFDDYQDLLALPVDVSADLAAHGLSFDQWRTIGWGMSATEPGMVLVEPELVSLRAQNMTDELILAIRPEVAEDDPKYRYSPSRLANSPYYYGVGGYSSAGGAQFGSEVYVSEMRRIQEAWLERNPGEHLAFVSGL